MKKISVILCTLLCMNFYAQTTDTETQLKENGIRLISDYQLTTNELNIILNFDFDSFRKDSLPELIQIVDGPMFELAPRIKPELIVNLQSHLNFIPTEEAKYAEVKKIHITTLDIF